MFPRKYNKQSKIKRFFLKILNIYAIDKETLNFVNPNYKNVNKNIHILNDKSFILSSGYLNLTRKINNVDIYLRYAPNNQLWNSSSRWKRIVPNINKKDLILTCLNSLKKSILNFIEKNNIKLTLHLISDTSNIEFDNSIEKLFDNKININFIKSKQKGNRGSFLECCDQAQKAKDIIFFVEDDYLFEPNCIDELIFSYTRLSTLFNNDIFLCPSDYPFYYDSSYNTSLFIGKQHRWRTVSETLLTFMFSKDILNKHNDKIRLVGEKENDPFEKPLHSLYEEVQCLAPVNTLANHISRGVPSVTEDWQKTWKKNYIKA